MMKVKVAPPHENEIIYIEVAVATEGGTPSPIKSGLKMFPPPMPRAPETHPPNNDQPISYRAFDPSISISHFYRIFAFLFCSYSFLTFLKEKLVRNRQKQKNRNSMNQSRNEHLPIPIRDGKLLFPLRVFVITMPKRRLRQMICLSHYL